MPVSTLGFSTSPVFGQHGSVSRAAAAATTGATSSSSSSSGVESAVILHRAGVSSAGYGLGISSSSSSFTGSSALKMSPSGEVDTAALALQLRRHERKRQLMRCAHALLVWGCSIAIYHAMQKFYVQSRKKAILEKGKLETANQFKPFAGKMCELATLLGGGEAIFR